MAWPRCCSSLIQFRLAVLLGALLLAVPPTPVGAQGGAAGAEMLRCVRDAEQLEQMWRAVRTTPPNEARALSYVQPSGATMDVRVPWQARTTPLFCAAVIWHDAHSRGADGSANGSCFPGIADWDAADAPQAIEPLEVVSVVGDFQNISDLVVRLAIPKTDVFHWCYARIVIAGYGEGSSLLAPDFGFDRIALLSRWHTALIAVIVWVVVAYTVTAVAVHRYWYKRFEGEGRSGLAILDPVYITAGPSGRASLSNLQVFLFSLLVTGILVFTLARLGTLSELSTDVLWLLGISAGGSAGAKLAETKRNRLSMENWTWLNLKGWVSDRRRTPTWGQLFTTEGEFDVSKFQMAAFSVIVAGAMVSVGVEQLSTFNIPDSLLGLLGLSQAVYVGGKTVAPPSVLDYNNKLNEVRQSEKAFIDAVADAGKTSPGTDRLDLDTARALAPDAFRAYFQEVEVAASMHRSILGVTVPAERWQPRLP